MQRSLSKIDPDVDEKIFYKDIGVTECKTHVHSPPGKSINPFLVIQQGNTDVFHLYPKFVHLPVLWVADIYSRHSHQHLQSDTGLFTHVDFGLHVTALLQIT